MGLGKGKEEKRPGDGIWELRWGEKKKGKDGHFWEGNPGYFISLPSKGRANRSVVIRKKNTLLKHGGGERGGMRLCFR